MKIRATITNGLSIDPRTIVHFTKDEVLEIGSKGLTKENLERLVEIGFAVTIGDEEVDKTVTELVNDLIEDDTKPEYKSITKKSDLETYAKEEYGIDLDKRLTLSRMIEQLESELGGEL